MEQIEIEVVEGWPRRFGQAGKIPFARAKANRLEIAPDSTRASDEYVAEVGVAVDRHRTKVVTAQRIAELGIEREEEAPVSLTKLR